MKKRAFPAFCLALCLACSSAMADIDLSAMTIDELKALNQSVVSEIMTRKDFNQVKVPAGIYKVGEDIPAGTYTLLCDEDYTVITVKDSKGNYTEKMYAIEQNEQIGKLELLNGESIEILSSVVFMPYVGLGF